MRKKHFIGLGGLLAVLGVAFVTGLLLWSGKPEADSDPRVTVDQGATATVKPQTQTYAEEFPATQNDYLGSAQRFTVFANTVNHESNILGNVAAGTINDSNGNDIQTESGMKDQLLTGTGEDAVGRDVSYYQTVTNKVPKSSDEAGMNPKVVLGQGVKGIKITTDENKPYWVNGNPLNNIASGQLFQEPITDDAPYINIYSVLEGLRARSDALAAENQQTDLTNLVTEADLKGNNAIFDLNNTGETDAYGDTYENAYALKLTKTSSANSDILLQGAKFSLTYPLYPAHYTGSGSPDPEKWVEMTPGSDLPVTDDDGNPVYDAQGNLETHKAKLYDSEHKEIAPDTTTPYIVSTELGC